MRVFGLTFKRRVPGNLLLSRSLRRAKSGVAFKRSTIKLTALLTSFQHEETGVGGALYVYVILL